MIARVPVVVVALVLSAATGCSTGAPSAGPPTALDSARLAAVGADPVLARGRGTVGSDRVGDASYRWVRGGLSAGTDLPGTPPEAASLSDAQFRVAWDAQRQRTQRAVAALARRIRAEGWEVGYAACSQGVSAREGSGAYPAAATWRLQARRSFAAAGGRFVALLVLVAEVLPRLDRPPRVTRGAAIPYHADPAQVFARTAPVVAAAQSCVDADRPVRALTSAGSPSTVPAPGPPR